MSLSDPKLIRLAVMRAGSRPSALLSGLAAAWFVSSVGGALTALLAGSTGFLLVVLGSLVLAPDVRREELEDEGRLALPGILERRQKKPERSRRPLPPELRTRFQELHREVHGMLENWPKGLVIPLEQAHLEAAPEAFRDLAHLRAGMSEGDPGCSRIEERLQGLEEQVLRLRKAWSLLVSQESQGEALELLEETGDALEALMEVEDSGC